MRIGIIIDKIEQIQENLMLIEQNLPDNFKDFANLGLIKDGIYKRLEYSVELIIDIMAIINTDLKLGIPKEDETILDNIEKNGIFPLEIVNLIRNLKSFRNILVHRYGKINDYLVFELLQERIEDFERVIESVMNLIESYQGKEGNLEKNDG